jgi:TldD protein
MMFDLLETALVGDDFLELRFHDRKTRSISVEDGQVEAARTARHAGVGVRALVDGAWGFASTSVLTKEALLRAVDSARAVARAAARTRAEKVKAPRLGGLASGTFFTDARDPLEDHSLEEKIELALRAERLARTSSQRVQSASARYSEIVDEKFILTSDGARVHLRDAKPEFRVGAVAFMEAELQHHSEAEGKTGGFGDLFARRGAEEMAEKAARTAVAVCTQVAVTPRRERGGIAAAR